MVYLLPVVADAALPFTFDFGGGGAVTLLERRGPEDRLADSEDLRGRCDCTSSSVCNLRA